MLENIKILLGITDNSKDALLNLLINQCTDEALDYTHRDDACDLESVIEQMVVYKYNRLGTEGLSSESYSGISYSYEKDYPVPIQRMLKRYRKIVTL